MSTNGHQVFWKRLSESDRTEILRIFGSVVPREKAYEQMHEKFPSDVSPRMAKEYGYKVNKGEIDSHLVAKIIEEDANKYCYFKNLKPNRNSVLLIEEINGTTNDTNGMMHLNSKTNSTNLNIRIKNEKLDEFYNEFDLANNSDTEYDQINDDQLNHQENLSNASNYSNNASNSEAMSFWKLLLFCKYCDNLIEQPINLPCGNTICQKHVEETFIKCKLCSKQHTKPVEGFQINKSYEMVLNSKIGDRLKSAKLVLNKFKRKLEDFDQLNRNQLKYTNDYFSQIENEIKRRRLDLKDNIDKNCNDLINRINEERSKCQLVKITSPSTNDIISFTRKKTELESRLKDSEDKNLENLVEEADHAIKRIDESMSCLKSSYLLNKTYKLLPNLSVKSDENMIGKLVIEENSTCKKKKN